jgi:hypothetical protein
VSHSLSRIVFVLDNRFVSPPMNMSPEPSQKPYVIMSLQQIRPNQTSAKVKCWISYLCLVNSALSLFGLCAWLCIAEGKSLWIIFFRIPYQQESRLYFFQLKELVKDFKKSLWEAENIQLLLKSSRGLVGRIQKLPLGFSLSITYLTVASCCYSS